MRVLLQILTMRIVMTRSLQGVMASPGSAFPFTRKR